MKGKKGLVVALILGLVVLAVLVGVYIIPKTADSGFARKFAAVDGGMTYDDVEQEFGRTWNGSGVLWLDSPAYEESYVDDVKAKAEYGLNWQFDEGRTNYVIYFDEDNRVIYKASSKIE